MDNTRAQQKALDDKLAAPTNRLKIRKNALKLTSFYKAFEITADVPEIYMQELWVIVSRHHSLLCFKLNDKSHTVNVDNFRDMLKIFPKLPGQIFEEPPLKEDILSFIRHLGHTDEIKFLSDVNVNHIHQPWRSFAAIINNCLSGKTIALESLPKAAKPAKKKQPAKTSKAKGLKVLSKVALTKAEQMKLATKRSLIENYSSHVSGSGADEGTGSKPGVPNVPTHGSDDEQISWKSSDEEDDDEVGLNDDDDNDDDEDNNDDDDDLDNQDDDDQEDDGQYDEDQDDVNEHTDSDNDGDDFVHPKLSTQDQEVRHNEEESDEEIQGANVDEEEFDEKETNDEDEENELYRDVNVNLEGRDIEMIDAQQTNVQTTQVIEDTHMIITPVNPEGQQQSSSVSSGFVSNMLNPSLDTCIDSIFNLNTESTSLIDVPVTTITEPPLLSTTTLPPLPTPLITHLQQTPVPTPSTVPSSSL
ncbi:hypothetical protein Tco_0612616 [Tanacetum coccineum]